MEELFQLNAYHQLKISFPLFWTLPGYVAFSDGMERKAMQKRRISTVAHGRCIPSLNQNASKDGKSQIGGSIRRENDRSTHCKRVPYDPEKARKTCEKEEKFGNRSSPATCSKCGKTFKTQRGLRHHLVFYRYNDLDCSSKSHQIRYFSVGNSSGTSSSQPTFKCYSCHETFPTQTLLDYHMVSHLKQENLSGTSKGSQSHHSSVGRRWRHSKRNYQLHEDLLHARILGIETPHGIYSSYEGAMESNLEQETFGKETAETRGSQANKFVQNELDCTSRKSSLFRPYEM